jgi:DNA-binding GntR family transcriptional regulator
MLAALEHALARSTMTWHAIGSDVTVRNALERLAKKGLIEINEIASQYRLASRG